MLLFVKNKNRLKQVRIVVEKVLICLCIEVNTVRNNSVLIIKILKNKYLKLNHQGLSLKS